MASGESPHSTNQSELASEEWGEFPSAIDRPAGRTDNVISAVTRQPLRYFTPDPLSELLDRCGGVQKPRSLPLNDGLAFMLSRVASRRGINGEVDALHAERFCGLIAKRLKLDSYGALLKLGNAISPRNRGLREEIMFSGGYIASSARTIFAPHALLPDLMSGLLIELQGHGRRRIDPALAAAITGFYCVSMHPFMDGNGRWSRLAAAAYGMSTGGTLAPMINAVFQNVAKAELVSNVWASARASGGLRTYMNATWRFEDAMLNTLEVSGALDALTGISTELELQAPGRRPYQEAMTILGVEGAIPIARFRTLFGQSQRAHGGMLARLHDVGKDFIALDAGHLSLHPLHIEIERAAANAAHDIFNGESK